MSRKRGNRRNRKCCREGLINIVFLEGSGEDLDGDLEDRRADEKDKTGFIPYRGGQTSRGVLE